MKIVRVLILVITSVLMPVLVRAQDPPPPQHEQNFEASYVGVSGNASSSTFGLGADVIARPDSWLIRNKASFVRNESNDVLLANALGFTSRAQKTIGPRASSFGEYGYFRDRFAGVANRNSVTGGFNLKVVNSRRHALGLEIGAGYVDEARLSGDDVSSGSFLTGTAYKLTLSESSAVTDDLRLTGLFEESSNWRLDHTIALTTRVAAGLSLKVSHAIRYSHQPPPGFKRTDATMAVALVARFTRP